MTHQIWHLVETFLTDVALVGSLIGVSENMISEVS